MELLHGYKAKMFIGSWKHWKRNIHIIWHWGILWSYFPLSTCLLSMTLQNLLHTNLLFVTHMVVSAITFVMSTIAIITIHLVSFIALEIIFSVKLALVSYPSTIWGKLRNVFSLETSLIEGLSIWKYVFQIWLGISFGFAYWLIWF